MHYNWKHYFRFKGHQGRMHSSVQNCYTEQNRTENRHSKNIFFLTCLKNALILQYAQVVMQQAKVSFCKCMAVVPVLKRGWI